MQQRTLVRVILIALLFALMSGAFSGKPISPPWSGNSPAPAASSSAP
jgi:hypothetical protein